MSLSLLERMSLIEELDTIAAALSDKSLPMLARFEHISRIDAIAALLDDNGTLNDPDAVPEQSQSLFDLVRNKGGAYIRAKHAGILKRLIDLAKDDKYKGKSHYLNIHYNGKPMIQALAITLESGLFVTVKEGALFSDSFVPLKKHDSIGWDLIHELFAKKLIAVGKGDELDMSKPLPKGEDGAADDRDNFTILRDGEYVTFSRGEEIKIMKSNSVHAFITVKITGISHANKQFTYNNGKHGLSFNEAYKLDYDEIAVARSDIAKYLEWAKRDIKEADRTSRKLEKLKVDLVELTPEIEQAKIELDKIYQSHRDFFLKRDSLIALVAKFEAGEINQTVSSALARFGSSPELQPFIDDAEVKMKAALKKHIALKQMQAKANQMTLDLSPDEELEPILVNPSVDKHGAFYQSIIDGAPIDQELLSQAIDYAKEDESHYLLPEVAEIVKDKLLKEYDLAA